jgi:VanZ family protein
MRSALPTHLTQIPLNRATPSQLRLRLLAPSVAVIAAATMIPTGLRHPSLSYIQNGVNPADFINNIILYLPLGIALSGSSLIRAFLSGLLLATCAEALQLGYVDRVPSFVDITSNTCGAVIGYLVARFFLGPGPRFLRLPRRIAIAAIPVAIIGTLALLHPRPKTDFSNWNPAYHLVAGNELTWDRAWSGTISELAIYPYAMSPSQLAELARQGSSVGNGTEGKGPSEAPIFGPIWPADFAAISGQTLMSEQQERNFYDTLVSRSQFTVLVWMETHSLNTNGVTRIVTYSRNAATRNFTLGQIGDTLTFRLRTPATGYEGSSPALHSGPVLSLNRPTFVAAVYDGRFSRLYVDGKSVAHADLGARRPRLPFRTMSWLPGSIPIHEIELAGAEILLSGLFAIGIFGWYGVPERPSRRYALGAASGAAIGAIVWVFAVSNPGLGIRILLECVAAGLVIAASVETETADSA